MHLAKMMHRTVDELLDSMSYPEMMRWRDYLELFPEEGWRADVRAAQICAILANVNRDKKARPQAYEIKDFMLFDRARNAAAEKRVQQEAGGAKVAPETLAWLFKAARKKPEAGAATP